MTKVLERLTKLKAHLESAKQLGSEAEAQAFADKIQQLLTEHKLSMSDVEYAALDQEEPVGYHEAAVSDLVRRGVRVRKRRVAWIEALAVGVAYGHFCQHVVHSGMSKISFVGRESDCEVAQHMLIILIRTAEELSEKAYVKYFYECLTAGDVEAARGFKPEWLDAFSYRVQTRYYVETQRVKAEHANNPAALVRLESSAIAIKGFFEKDERFKKSMPVGGSNADNPEGRRQGTEAANRQKLRDLALPNRPGTRRLT